MGKPRYAADMKSGDMLPASQGILHPQTGTLFTNTNGLSGSLKPSNIAWGLHYMLLDKNDSSLHIYI